MDTDISGLLVLIGSLGGLLVAFLFPGFGVLFASVSGFFQAVLLPMVLRVFASSFGRGCLQAGAVLFVIGFVFAIFRGIALVVGRSGGVVVPILLAVGVLGVPSLVFRVAVLAVGVVLVPVGLVLLLGGFVLVPVRFVFDVRVVAVFPVANIGLGIAAILGRFFLFLVPVEGGIDLLFGLRRCLGFALAGSCRFPLRLRFRFWGFSCFGRFVCHICVSSLTAVIDLYRLPGIRGAHAGALRRS